MCLICLNISRQSRARQDLENARNEFKYAEEHLWMSRLDKDEKCKKLEFEIASIRKQ